MKKDYLPRLFDETLEFSLKSKGAVLVVGPKWCGKTRTCSRHAKTIIEMLPADTRKQNVLFAKNAPSLFLSQGPKPILIDEWQIISFIWDSIKTEVDKNDDFGQFILTGSVTDRIAYDGGNKEEQERHTGNGRITIKKLRTMSLFESGDSNGTVSLSKLGEGIFEEAISNADIEDYAYRICRGGWPLAIGENKDVALQQAIDYYDMLYNEDVFSIRDIKFHKDTTIAEKVIRSYARNIGTSCASSLIADDAGIDKETMNKFDEVLQRLYILDNVRAWSVNLRSRTAIRTKDTRYFVDPSIATAALGLTPSSLFKDMNYFGFLFESLAIRDLKIYSESINAKLFHYRDKRGLEADAVLVYKNGEFALIEIKLGDDESIDLAAKNLLKLQDDLIKKPLYLMVITKSRYAYKRDDGVYVVPLATLRN